ncbi:MAG: hypothetical protein M3347_05860 [Armatimonadota bacterium]|nr:hypothetical protein [Armatimonadota bacterium]
MDDMTGKNLMTFGTRGQGVGQFDSPSDIFVDNDGHIYVADAGNSRIVRMDDMTGKNWTTYETKSEIATLGGIFIGPKSSGLILNRDTSNQVTTGIPTPESTPASTPKRITHPVDDWLITRFVDAVQKTDFATVRKLLKEEPELVNHVATKPNNTSYMVQGLTPLTAANNLEMVQLLVERGADVNLANRLRGETRFIAL